MVDAFSRALANNISQAVEDIESDIMETVQKQLDKKLGHINNFRLQQSSKLQNPKKDKFGAVNKPGSFEAQIGQFQNQISSQKSGTGPEKPEAETQQTNQSNVP